MRLRWMAAVCALLMTAPVLAIDANFTDLDGKPVQLSQFKGKWVVVNYWATWCPPCVHELPELSAFHEANKQGKAVVLGVNHEEAPVGDVKKFMEGYLVSYPVVRDNGSPSSKTPFGVLRGLPTTFMINPQGELVAARTGMVSQKMLEQFIQDNSK